MSTKSFFITANFRTYLQKYRRCMHKCHNKVELRNHCCCGKEITFTYSECVFVTFFIRHAKRMRRIKL